MRLRISFLILSVALLSGCASLPPATAAAASTAAPTASLQGDAARPAQAPGWVRSELYFGVGSEDGSSARVKTDAISEERWRAFLDAEVTPRFPDGLTVFDAYGQWLFRGAAQPNRLRTKVLVILHEDSPSDAPTSRRSAWPGSRRPAISRCCGCGSRPRCRSEPGAARA